MHSPEANLPVTRSLSTRMARWGLVIVGIYLLVALITPLLVGAGILPDANAGLENPIYSGPSWTHWCGTDRLGRDVCVRTMAGSGVALQVVLLPLFAILLNVPLFEALPGILVPVVLGTFGFATIGTLFSAMSVNTRLKEAMLPMLTLPILVPMLLASVETFKAMLSGGMLAASMDWLRIGVAFCGIFLVFCLWLFEYVVEE